MKRLLLATSALVAATAAQAGTQTISLYNDQIALPSSVSATSGTVQVAGTQGYENVTGASNGKTFGRELIQMGNGSATITFHLTGLQSHTSLNLDFLLAAIDSLDGTSTDGVGPDYFSVSIDLDGDGSTETSLWNYAYLNCDRVNGAQNAPTGGTLAYRQDLFNSQNTDTCFRDSAYDMGVQSAFQNISHTLSDLTVSFSVSGLQDISDESYGIDALSVILNGTPDSTNVPEPAMLGLFGLGALGVALSRRRRA